VKFTKIFRILTLAAIVSLLLLVIPAPPALALDYDIELDPDEGEIGDRFYVRGEDWPESDPYPAPPEEVDIYFSRDEADEGDEIDDEVINYEDFGSDTINEDGVFSKRVTVPDELTDGDEDEVVHGGTYYVYVTMEGDDEIEAVAEFKVIAGEITLDPTSGVVGTEVEITGQYFSDEEDITVEYDDDEIDIEEGDTSSDDDGEFTCSILVPASTADDHTITVTGDEGSEASDTFTVEPEITVDPTSGVPADTISVSGTGFGAEHTIDILFETYVVDTGETNEDGSFDASFEVPDVDEGSYNLKVDDKHGHSVETDFTVNIATEVNVAPVTSQTSPGYVGMDVTISGVGFEPSHPITITYASTPAIFTTNSTPDGTFIATFEVPPSEAGAHTITASDGTNSLQVLFYMESEAPSTPQPLLPETGTRAPALAEFSWGAVTDDSPPVTYTLQVATNDNFTAGSIVLNEEGLTNLTYTITEEDRLEPRSQEEPYYWRVKAVDAASNESPWSTPGSFDVGGFGISLPSWQIHLWWGLGVVGAIFLGYWIGKRRAAYSY
jgi:hypothetical protein